MAQDRWGNASTRGRRQVLDEQVEKFSIPSINSLKTLGHTAKLNFNGGAGMLKPKLAAPTQGNFNVARATNYALKNKKPLALGAAVGGGAVGTGALVNKADRKWEPEAARQRRLGGMAAAAGATGLGLSALAARRMHIGSKALRELADAGPAKTRTVHHPAVPGKDGKPGKRAKDEEVPNKLQSTPAVLRRRSAVVDAGSAGMLGGAGLSFAGAAGTHHYAKNPRRNREWN